MADAVNVMSLSNEEIIAKLTEGGVTVEEGATRPVLIKAYSKMVKDASADGADDGDGADEGKDKGDDGKPQEDGKKSKEDAPAKSAPAPKADKEEAKDPKPAKSGQKTYEVLSRIKMGGTIYEKGDKIPYFEGIEKMGHAVKL